MLWKQRKVQMAAVAALGAVMVAATLIVGLGRDGGDRSIESLSELDRPSVAPSVPKVTGAPPSAAPPNAAPSKAAPPPRVDSRPAAEVKVTVSASGTLAKDKRTFKVVSARGDLTGQRELRWVADAGHAVGDARCTQTFRFNPQSKAGVKPTLLICWRLSPTKSVYTVLVDLNHKPSAKASVAAIDKTWRSMR
jgi:hypothetical protein